MYEEDIIANHITELVKKQDELILDRLKKQDGFISLEESKHYEPKLEELNSETEFEVYSCEKGMKFNQVDGWYPVKMDFGILGELQNLTKLLFDGYIRIKILDKEDIESFGFILDPKASNEERWNFEKYVEHRTIGVTLFEGCEVIVYNFAEGREHVIFDGVIKNKSEFKILMKQLGI